MNEHSPLAAPETAARSNFIREIIEAHRADGRYPLVITRFPPEPNGYLHIGHAKSICLNFGLARDFGGRCHLRFDDTNPTTEDMEYVESIQRDVRWLGFDWGEHKYHASDYFDQLYEVAVRLVERDKAYVCALSEEEIREYRGTLTVPGRPSPFRDRSIDENLDLFARMRAGEFEDGSMVLRAKIDMAASNMKMRDPLLYRIRHAHHYRTGDQWCIYPMYDFAHCLSDAFESISHSICTLEFENNRELYDWILENAGFEEPRPHQYEFARLNLTYTVMSKRKLLELVGSGQVNGWDDPRMPTIAGMRRRGITPDALRAFAELIGVAKTNSTVDIDKLEYCIRDDLNAKAPRAFAVLRPLKVVITNYPEGAHETLDVPSWPHDVPNEGSRAVPFSREIFIESDDFTENPPSGWRRLVPNGEVRLRYAYVIRCDEVIRDAATGDITELRCTYDPTTGHGAAPHDRKVKGIIHWVSAPHATRAEVRLIDRLFSVERPDADPLGREYAELLHPRSLEILSNARVEPSVGNAPPGSRFQFERLGYFYLEPEDSTPNRPVFNRIVGLKDSWAKQSAAESGESPLPPPSDEALPKERQRPAKRSKSELAERTRAADNVLAERFERWPRELGIAEDDADLLTRDRELSDFFDAALRGPAGAKALAAWVLNDVLREAKERPLASLRLEPGALADLVARVESGDLTPTLAREVLAVLAREGGTPESIIVRHNLRPVDDDAELAAIVNRILGEHPAEAARLRAGEHKLMGLFVGHVMKASQGKANARRVTELLRTHLGG